MNVALSEHTAFRERRPQASASAVQSTQHVTMRRIEDAPLRSPREGEKRKKRLELSWCRRSLTCRSGSVCGRQVFRREHPGPKRALCCPPSTLPSLPQEYPGAETIDPRPPESAWAFALRGKRAIRLGGGQQATITSGHQSDVSARLSRSLLLLLRAKGVFFTGCTDDIVKVSCNPA